MTNPTIGQRGDALLECVIFLPILLGIGFFTLDFSARAFQTSQLSQIAHTAIEKATILRKEQELATIAEETFKQVDAALANPTDLMVRFTLLSPEGAVLEDATTHRGKPKTRSLESEFQKLSLSPKSSTLPYSIEDIPVNFPFHYLAIQIFISAKPLLPGEPTDIQETQIRLLREVL